MTSTAWKMEPMNSIVGDCGKAGRENGATECKILGHITVRTMPLYWRKERCHGRLGVTLKLLGKM